MKSFPAQGELKDAVISLWLSSEGVVTHLRDFYPNTSGQRMLNYSQRNQWHKADDALPNQSEAVGQSFPASAADAIMETRG